MNTKTDKKLDRILTGKPDLANTLKKVTAEARRRAMDTQDDHVVCMDRIGKLHIRVAQDYLEETHKLTSLVFCFINGKCINSKQGRR